MASNLTGLSVWEFLKLKVGGLLTLNSGGTKEVVYATEDATGETAISIGGEVVQRRSATGHKIMSESTLGSDKITNGDCETFTGGMVTGWSEYDPAGLLTLEEETVDVYAGSKSQKITRASGATYAALTSNNMAMTKGKWYIASFALKVASGTLRCWINTADSSVQLHTFGSLAPAEWTLYSTAFYCTQTKTNYVFRFDTAFTAATAIIDAVSVKEITQGDMNIADDLTVGGTIHAAEAISTEATIASRDAITSGVEGSVRGQLKAARGPGTTTPGVVVLEARDGTEYYEWRTAAGRKRVSMALPTSDTDGDDSIDIEGTLTTGGAATIGGAIDATGNITTNGNVAAGGNLSGVDIAASGAASVGGNATVTGNVVTSGDVTAATGKVSALNAEFTGALDVAGAATIGGNVVSDGNVSAQGGSVVAGNYGLTRGVVKANPGDGGNKAGAFLYYMQNGQPVFSFAGIGGYLRTHSTEPSSLTDGTQVGAQIIEGVFQVGEEDTTPGVSTVHGDANGVGGVRVYVSPNGTKYYFWVTNAGVLRRHTAMPTNWDTDGAVVGPGI